ncbi:hypothetical protein [Legionella taurinensis]|nr:hypothetical protein [Legionella taurinensis]MDX1838542.1 hypothetical protein [Legionella taurinensis]
MRCDCDELNYKSAGYGEYYSTILISSSLEEDAARIPGYLIPDYMVIG